MFALEDFCREFRLKIEAFGTDHHSIHHYAAENLVASFHIGKNGIVKKIGEQCQQFVGYQVPEHGHAVRRTEKTGAVDNIRQTFLDGLEESRVITGVMFEIGVLDQLNVTLGSP